MNDDGDGGNFDALVSGWIIREDDKAPKKWGPSSHKKGLTGGISDKWEA